MILSSLFEGIIKDPGFEFLRQNTPGSADSCLKNVETFPLEEYIQSICLNILIALQKNSCPPTLSKSVLNAYFAVSVIYWLHQWIEKTDIGRGASGSAESMERSQYRNTHGISRRLPAFQQNS